MKDNVKASYLDSGIDIKKVHGHMDLVLTNVKISLDKYQNRERN